jgi:hypothetical protein
MIVLDKWIIFSIISIIIIIIFLYLENTWKIAIVTST